MTISGLHPERQRVSEGQKFNADSLLVAVDCCSCGVRFAIPDSFDRAARKYNSSASPRNYWTICCPFGHEWHYTGRNETQRLRQKLQATRDLLEHEERAHRGTKISAGRAKAERDRLKKRASVGVCPCCNRTFQQLARHMKAKHPTYAGKS